MLWNSDSFVRRSIGHSVVKSEVHSVYRTNDQRGYRYNRSLLVVAAVLIKIRTVLHAVGDTEQLKLFVSFEDS